MRFKALLFCPDDKAARLVTQVLTELDFTVELSGEPFSTVKRLTDEHFHALVVDCENEQNAALLFKGARNSTLNHGSLYVAVVEGQSGVAKAFRIGANLVLTKPINIEQSKSTLRVARGLLRKSEAKPAAQAPGSRVEPISQAPNAHAAKAPTAGPALSPATPAPQPTATAPAYPAASASPAATGFSMIEMEPEPEKAPEPADAALLESIPDAVPAKPASAEPSPAAPKSAARPIAIKSIGPAATAVQPALEKPGPERTHTPAARKTDDAAEKTSLPRADELAVPTFVYAADSRRPRTTKALRIVAVILVVGGLGYAAWQHRETLAAMIHPRPLAGGETAPSKGQTAPSPAGPGEQTADQPSASLPNSAIEAGGGSAATNSSGAPAHKASRPETVEVSEVPEPEPKLTVTPKLHPLQVKTGGRLKSKTVAPVAPVPPELPASSSATAADLSGIVSGAAAAPILGGTLRVSQGVSQGLLIKKVAPVYPQTALQLRQEGSVELLATVSKTGAIANVKVLSGDHNFTESAVNAVRQWKYRPYLLNSEPVDIETQITIRFRLPR